LKVSTKKGKWPNVKAKTIDYFKAISIPGVSKIITTESYLLKLFWTVVILCVFGFGFQNISLAVNDYYKYDKITNIERVTPKYVTFPAITICSHEGYVREYYKNGSIIERKEVLSNSLKHFLNFNGTFFYSTENSSNLSVNNHLDIFKIKNSINKLFVDCLRFNAVTNKSVKLFKASSPDQDRYRIQLNSFYLENISNNEYYRYIIKNYYILVYVSENSLNSFENLYFSRISTNTNNSYTFGIQRVSIEIKLPEPYNSCKESSVGEPYNRMNCIEACKYKEIKNKYNCTFQSTLFSIQGLRQCVLNYTDLIAEFSVNCSEECSLESCFSEKFTYEISNSNSDYTDSIVVRFLLRDMSTLNITQIPKTDGFTFLNNIGGGLGLFMGIAFPNLIEFLQFIFEIFSVIIYQ